ncbi:MAG TPA: hypothetical protein VK826_13680 [Bacteroidia bacterium]|nr:hypothetical protein [Bacteroidia bacterium]
MPVTIDKGGEEIPDNTYGFEIEFCSHDNSVFAFTHVDTVNIFIRVQGRADEEWKIETDSGNVLELVTSKLTFRTIAAAYEYKDKLAAILAESVNVPCTYHEWVAERTQPLRDHIQTYYGLCHITILGAPYESVRDSINVENVDDGINIQAAKVRLVKNEHQWADYLGATVVSHSEKDWAKGYSSQVNMPMSAAGYFLYSVYNKLPKGQLRFERMVDFPQGYFFLTTEKLENRLVTWFWRSIQFAAFFLYAKRTFEGDVTGLIRACLPDERALYPSELQKLNMREEDLKVPREAFDRIMGIMPEIYAADKVIPSDEDLTRLGVLYITVGKMLTGALGNLSETNQLELQFIAWNLGSTEGMAPPIIQSEKVMAQRRWLEYHNSMKDLTGLWFKGALLDVISKERYCYPLRNDPEIWSEVIGTFVSLMNASRWDKGRIYPADLDELHFKELSERIGEIENLYNQYVVALNGRIPNFDLPERKKRKFLHYGELEHSAWEGRYDTMVPSIPGREGYERTTYLIEHRFN